jgi:hypothetical protein
VALIDHPDHSEMSPGATIGIGRVWPIDCDHFHTRARRCAPGWLRFPTSARDPSRRTTQCEHQHERCTPHDRSSISYVRARHSRVPAEQSPNSPHESAIPISRRQRVRPQSPTPTAGTELSLGTRAPPRLPAALRSPGTRPQARIFAPGSAPSRGARVSPARPHRGSARPGGTDRRPKHSGRAPGRRPPRVESPSERTARVSRPTARRFAPRAPARGNHEESSDTNRCLPSPSANRAGRSRSLDPVPHD